MQRRGGTTGSAEPLNPLLRPRLILGGIAGLLIIADQATKLLVRHTFVLGESVRVFGDFFRLTYILNPAGAFGITFGHPSIYFIASIVIAILISINLYRFPLLRQWSVWGLTLVLAGAIGNVIDRLYLGEVVDFFDVEFFDVSIPSFKFLFIHFPGYAMTRWPVFNIADSAVTVGIVLLLVSAWLDPQKSKAEAQPSDVAVKPGIDFNSDPAQGERNNPDVV